MSELIRPVYSLSEPVIVAGVSYYSDYSEKYFHKYVVLPKRLVEENNINFREQLYFYEIEGKHSEIELDTDIHEMSIEEAYKFLADKELYDYGEDILERMLEQVNEGQDFDNIDVDYLFDFHENLKENLFNIIKDSLNFKELRVEIPEVLEEKFRTFLEENN